MKNKMVVFFSIILLVSLSVFTAIKNNGVKMNQEIQCSEISAKHILVESEKLANEILKDINDGKISFEEGAKKFSKCPSGNTGGDLGYFRRGMMVKEFETAAFSTPKGEVSAPVKTGFGWHLIKVIDKR